MDAPALIDAAARMGVTLSAVQAGQLQRYVVLLEKWNARFNLVSRKDIGRLWSRHILDSLSVLPLLQRTAEELAGSVEALDVGTGAGLPGLPLAIADPQLAWHLVDRNARKIRFVELVVADLGLANATTHCLSLGPEEVLKAVPQVGLIVSRAVDSADRLVQLAGPLLQEGGAMILLTSTDSSACDTEDDLQSGIHGDFRVEARHGMQIPGLDQAHEVIIIRHD